MVHRAASGRHTHARCGALQQGDSCGGRWALTEEQLRGALPEPHARGGAAGPVVDHMQALALEAADEERAPQSEVGGVRWRCCALDKVEVRGRVLTRVRVWCLARWWWVRAEGEGQRQEEAVAHPPSPPSSPASAANRWHDDQTTTTA